MIEEGQPPLLMNFEDAADIAKKQQFLKEHDAHQEQVSAPDLQPPNWRQTEDAGHNPREKIGENLGENQKDAVRR